MLGGFSIGATEGALSCRVQVGDFADDGRHLVRKLVMKAAAAKSSSGDENKSVQAKTAGLSAQSRSRPERRYNPTERNPDRQQNLVTGNVFVLDASAGSHEQLANQRLARCRAGEEKREKRRA